MLCSDRSASRAGQLDPGLGQGPIDRVQHRRQRVDDRLSRLGLGAADDRPACRLLGGDPVAFPLAFEVFGAELLDPHAFLGRLHPQPGLNLRLACRVEVGGDAVRGTTTSRIGRGRERAVSSSAAARSESAVASRTLWVMVAVARSKALHLGGGGFGLHPGHTELLGVGGALRIELAQCAQRGGGALLGHLQFRALLGKRAAGRAR